MTPSDITAAALSLVGTRFHPQGRLPGVGLDCIGVMVCTAVLSGMQIKDRTVYPLRPNGELMQELDARLIRVRGEMQEGDVLVMSFGGEPHHVAMYISENRIVHAYTGVRKCVVQPFTGHWKSAVRAVYRFPEVA